MTSTVLDYKGPTAGPRKKRQVFYVWVLPLLVVPGSLASTHWPGDEYGGELGAHLPVFGLLLLLGSRPLAEWIFATATGLIASTVVLLTILGLLMDVLRIPRRLVFLLPLIFVALALSRVCVPGNVPPLKDMRNREWDPDSLSVAWCWSVYALAACFLPPVAFMRITKTVGRFIARRNEVG